MDEEYVGTVHIIAEYMYHHYGVQDYGMDEEYVGTVHIIAEYMYHPSLWCVGLWYG